METSRASPLLPSAFGAKSAATIAGVGGGSGLAGLEAKALGGGGWGPLGSPVRGATQEG